MLNEFLEKMAQVEQEKEEQRQLTELLSKMDAGELLKMAQMGPPPGGAPMAPPPPPAAAGGISMDASAPPQTMAAEQQAAAPPPPDPMQVAQGIAGPALEARVGQLTQQGIDPQTAGVQAGTEAAHGTVSAGTADRQQQAKAMAKVPSPAAAAPPMGGGAPAPGGAPPVGGGGAPPGMPKTAEERLALADQMGRELARELDRKEKKASKGKMVAIGLGSAAAGAGALAGGQRVKREIREAKIEKNLMGSPGARGAFYRANPKRREQMATAISKLPKDAGPGIQAMTRSVPISDKGLEQLKAYKKAYRKHMRKQAYSVLARPRPIGSMSPDDEGGLWSDKFQGTELHQEAVQLEMADAQLEIQMAEQRAQREAQEPAEQDLWKEQDKLRQQRDVIEAKFRLTQLGANGGTPEVNGEEYEPEEEPAEGGEGMEGQPQQEAMPQAPEQPVQEKVAAIRGFLRSLKG